VILLYRAFPTKPKAFQLPLAKNWVPAVGSIPPKELMKFDFENPLVKVNFEES
jgi:hypothetical protein